ncbi:MAG TPA: hypothetical protein DD811_00665 [Syntrophomonas sp.]|jgi:uncharacterized protein YlxW (UPF0749 family)|nr:hypothetical protein [Syntrophomonas sp.]
MLAVQYRTSNRETELLPGRDKELLLKLQTVTEERDSLAREVISLRDKLSNIGGNDKATSDLQDELRKANLAAGLIPVHGPGIIVTLNDSPQALQAGSDPNALLVHDDDLLRVTNELKASGAEAISVNNERLTATSEIRCAGTTILVNTSKIAPPFVIKAIGDPDILQSGVQIKYGYLEQLKAIGIQVQVQKVDDVTVPAYAGLTKFNYSKPVQYKEKAD